MPEIHLASRRWRGFPTRRFLLAASAAVVLTPIGAGAQEPAAGGAKCVPEQVYSVDAAALDVTNAAVTIAAEGTASSAGWKSIALAPQGVSSDGATATYDLIGCQPQGFAAQVMSPVSAKLTVAIDARQRIIVIRAKTNNQSLTIADFRK